MKILNNLSWFLFLVFFFFCLSCSDREITAYQLQQRGELYYAVNEENPYTDKVVKLYKNGQKSFEHHYKNGHLHGLYTEWYDNGQKKKELA